MKQQEIHSYLNRFFTATGCEIEENTASYLTVQLTIDMDKALMNRPFYWHYVEKTGGIPAPKKLTLITNYQNAQDIAGEAIHFGSPRLHQIFTKTRELGGFIRLYENVTATLQQNIPLMPWIGLNMNISYICDRKKDSFRSIGLNLINGALMEDFHSNLEKIKNNLVAKIPDYCFTLSPLIKPVSGIKRVEQYILNDIYQDDHTWAEQAKERWKSDLQLLDYFYEGIDDKPERYYTEKDALQDQYEPKIEVSIINGGIFYLSKNQFTNEN